LVLRELKRAGLAFESRRVWSGPDLRAALADFRPCLVISDYSMPGFNGFEALGICRESAARLPFIFVSGTVGETVAVDSLRAGATDYIMKSDLRRLGPAVRRELQAAHELRAREARDEAVFEHAAVGIARSDFAGRYLTVNAKFCEIFGCTREQALARSFR